MRNIILGTDWWTDCDDAVALRLMARAAIAGEIRLLGVGINACMEYSVSSLVGFLSAEGLADVPVGIDRAGTDFGAWGAEFLYQKHLTERFCPCGTNDSAEDLVHLYRRLLAEAEKPVEIVEIGFLQGIAAVLKSEADDISPKSGQELFREKVSKVWVMAGKWDKDGEREHNFCNNDRSRRGGEEFCRLCPVPVTFLGWEVGINVLSGDTLAHGDYLYRVLVDHGSPDGRHSWDPMLVLLALVGDEACAGYRTVRGLASVDAETGCNYFVERADGPHAYVVKAREDSYYKNAINERIV